MSVLISTQPRARWMRTGTARILKRFHFCERSLIVSCSGWLPRIATVENKTLLPLFSWQNAKTANELRERVFELRYPNREMDEEGADHSLVELFDELRHSPSETAFFAALAHVLLPAMLQAYQQYMAHSDELADAPTRRFLGLAQEEKQRQLRTIASWSNELETLHPSDRPASRAWVAAMEERLTLLGGVGTDLAPPDLPASLLPGRMPYAIPDRPARDPAYRATRFYWPDNVDPNYAYGEEHRLQLRSAVSHLNEVWAVETGGIVLSAFAAALPWEWIYDASRWTYDESRHCRMGRDRLTAWGYQPHELPLGTFIYDSAAGQDPILRLGMLFFFETKNIGHKPARVKAFQSIGDAASEHDMDFDWADETMHAGYGRKWLQKLMELRGEDPSHYKSIRERCSALVEAVVSTATPEEVAELKQTAEAIVEKALLPV